MKVYKLKYSSQEEGVSDLIERGIINEELEFQEGTIAVVYVGYNEEGSSYGIDIMLQEEMEFDNEVFPETPSHMFAGVE
jgi:hypothetical protein